ncbi:MAG TPA: phage tail sheath subtilisin-like domain-containing protein, partial [Nitrososphaeraceae archaeon]|nr:phage tail sheath subtilisin-like domain-containing protein [Nitrososphaeraceae archaeon]
KEVKKAFLNGVFQVVATRVGGNNSYPASAILKSTNTKRKETIKLIARELGERGNKIQVKVMRGATENTVRLEISAKNSLPEEYENLSMLKDNEFYIEKILNENSRILTAQLLSEPSLENIPIPQEVSLSGGQMGPPSTADYEQALEQLELEENIDVVYVTDNWDPEIHALVDAHCQNMSIGKEPKPLGPRIGIGTVAPNELVNDIIKRTTRLASDRFILVAPYVLAGAVAGLISKLNYFESPTFKPLTGVSSLERRYTPSEQMKLLTNGVLPIDSVRGRGIIIVKGITTSKEQISVMRIADRSVRGVKNVSDLFIGTLNNERGRLALKERITEFLIGMERE